MPMLVCTGAQLQCSFGASPSALAVPPAHQVMTGPPAATIMDNIPITNVPPFGMCSTESNPAVAAATAAAGGAMTPVPCMPVLTAPWTPGSPTVMIGNLPALNQTSMLTCSWGGVIQILSPGEFTVQVP